MEQTQNRISDERLAELTKLDCLAGHWTTSDCHICERRELARELIQVRSDLTKYKKALHDHLCEYDAADWLGCAGHPDGDNCVLCDADRGLLPTSGCFHENLVNQTRELTALRASHKRLVEVAGSVPFRFAWCSDSDEHGPFCRCGRRELTAALADACELEGK